MRGKLLLVVVVWGVGAGLCSDLLACGNKFLVASRGTRFGRAPIARAEARILVYANPSSFMSNAIGNVPVDEVLVNAGYQPTTVTDSNELRMALAAGQWDLVLADLADSHDLSGQLEGVDPPMVVPVLFEPTRDVMVQAKKDFPRVVRAPIKSQRFLQTIDDAVAFRAKS